MAVVAGSSMVYSRRALFGLAPATLVAQNNRRENYDYVCVNGFAVHANVLIGLVVLKGDRVDKRTALDGHWSSGICYLLKLFL